MKNIWTACLAVALTTGCTKPKSAQSIETATLANNWQLAQVNEWIGAGAYSKTPAADSSVLLELNLDGTYTSLLNGHLVCQSTWSFNIDSNNAKSGGLELNNFVQTGLFDVWTESQDNNGVLTVIDNRMEVNISHDTLYLSPGFISFGGGATYIFLKK
jgi:hypothetical protein